MKKFLAIILVLAICLSFAASAFWAEGESAEKLKLWFEHPTKRVSEFTKTPSGMESYQIFMAKNEIEGAQFVLLAEEEMTSLTAALSDFSDGKGNVLTADLFWEYYTPVAGDSVPDAIPPLDGPFSLEAGYSKAFYLKLKTVPETPAGLYTATLTISDSSGAALKTADVSVKVFDFALPEKTSCETAFYLDRGQVYNKHKASGLSEDELYKIYYDYMLENRVCAYSLPYDLRSDASVLAEYLDNPRVNSFRVGDFTYDGQFTTTALKKIYRTLSQKQEWLDKAYFYEVDEPRNQEQLDKIISGRETIRTAWPGAKMMVPVVHDIEVSDTVDACEYIKDAIDIWCPLTPFFTPADTTVEGAFNPQPSKYNVVLGTFEERIEKEREAGKKIWWYTCCNPQNLPYNNILMTQPGMSGRLLFWQQKQYNIEGFLYYYVNLWFNENYWDHLDYPWSGGNAYGDGILLYDGAKYGVTGPIGSLRFEAIRDGIEDFEVLTMLEDVAGREVVDSYIEKLSTDVVTATTDDNLLMNTKNELYSALETALKPPCAEGEHKGGTATCVAKAVCEVCGREYGEVDSRNHHVEDGVCTWCGNEVAAFIWGDVDGNGKVESKDKVLTSRYLAKWTMDDGFNKDAVDFDKDGEVKAADAVILARYLAKWSGLPYPVGEPAN